MFYCVVSFGSPSVGLTDTGKRRVFSTVEAARKVAFAAPNHVTARVYACETRELARTADISRVREGESIV